jgi:hypothetical protein
MLEILHGQIGCEQAQPIRKERAVEESEPKLRQLLRLPVAQDAGVNIVFDAEGKEQTRQDDVPQAQHTKLHHIIMLIYIGELQFERKVDALGHSHHHISLIHPEQVIQKEQPQNRQGYLE